MPITRPEMAPHIKSLGWKHKIDAELRNFRDIVRILERSPCQGIRRSADNSLDGASALKGASRNLETSSHAYVEVVGAAPVDTKCCQGDHELSGVYHDWLSVNDGYCARFAWRHQPVRGFSFRKPHSPDQMMGARWLESEAEEDHQEDPDTTTELASTWIPCLDRSIPK